VASQDMRYPKERLAINDSVLKALTVASVPTTGRYLLLSKGG
jgi:hypothetical protein